jgi:lipocalin
MLASLVFSAALSAPVASTESTPLCTNPMEKCSEFKVAKYTGKWFEIASTAAVRLVEGQGACVQANYAPLSEGKIAVFNTIVRDGQLSSINGTATALSTTEFQVAFPGVPTFPGPNYIVLNVWQNANGYQRALVVGPKRLGAFAQFIWVLSRSPLTSDAEIEESLQYARQAGYNPESNGFQRRDQSVATCGEQ